MVVDVQVTYDEAKFAELVLHVAERLQDDPSGGATKLNKVLFFAEFTHVRRHGSAISGCEFQHLEHGPAPRRLRPVRDQLVQSGSAELVSQDFLGRRQDRLVPNRPAQLGLFTNLELETIDDVLAQLGDLTPAEVSDLSHQEPGWSLTAVGDTIPYESALLGFRQVSTPTSRRLTDAVTERYGLTTT